MTRSQSLSPSSVRVCMAVLLGALILTGCKGPRVPTRAPLHDVPATAATAHAARPAATSTSSDDSAFAEPGTTLAFPLSFDHPVESPLPSPTSIPQPVLRQLTQDGCCPQPFWSPDSRFVQFLDGPPRGTVGVYALDVVQPGPPVLLSERIIGVPAAGQFYIYPDGDATVVEHVVTGEMYRFPTGGRPVSVSQDGTQVLWQVFEQSGEFDKRRAQTYVANLAGGNARVVGETLGVIESQWIDARRVLLVGVPLNEPFRVGITAVSLGIGSTEDSVVELARVARPRGTVLSPAGTWLVYLLTFQVDPNEDGLWLVPTDGSQPPRKLGFLGSYRWRDDMHLLYVPIEPGVQSHVLWEYDTVRAQSRPLTNPAQMPFKIANNDWSVSPNGQNVVFVSAADRNLWILELVSTQ